MKQHEKNMKKTWGGQRKKSGRPKKKLQKKMNKNLEISYIYTIFVS